MPDTPFYLQSHFKEQVKDAFEPAVQQTMRKFRDAGIIDPDWNADQVVFRTRRPIGWVETTGQRGGKTQKNEFQAGYRSGFKRDFESGVTFDRNDARKLATANLPTSESQQDMAMTWNQKWDEVFLEEAQKPSLGGEKPYISSQALPTDMVIPVDWNEVSVNAGVNSGLTLWKIQEAITRMQLADVDLDAEMLTLAITPRMKQKWLQYVKTSPNDFFASMVGDYLKDKNKPVMNCRVLESNKIRRNSSGHEQAVIYSKKAFKVSPERYEIKVDELPDDRHAIQIAAYATTGIVRRYDEYVKLLWVDTNGVMV